MKKLPFNHFQNTHDNIYYCIESLKANGLPSCENEKEHAIEMLDLAYNLTIELEKLIPDEVL